MFITEHREQQAYQNEALQAKTTLNVDLFIYIDASDMNAVPAISLNVIMDAIEAALAPAPMDNNRRRSAAWSPIAASTARS